ncbi:uncharacterized protein TNCV_2308781 [Trichonephila clavipes]|nr:uncharacterized protein TNCV_2308781 [Trichonephila clavipes]
MLNSCVIHRNIGPVMGIMVLCGIGYHSRTPLERIAGENHILRSIGQVVAYRASTPQDPYFFEEDKLAVKVTSDCYYHMIETFLRPKLNQFLRSHEEVAVWFQKDGITAHTLRRLLDILRELFPGRILSLRGDIAWLSRKVT